VSLAATMGTRRSAKYKSHDTCTSVWEQTVQPLTLQPQTPKITTKKPFYLNRQPPKTQHTFTSISLLISCITTSVSCTTSRATCSPGVPVSNRYNSQLNLHPNGQRIQSRARERRRRVQTAAATHKNATSAAVPPATAPRCELRSIPWGTQQRSRHGGGVLGFGWWG
jgi:hypothetical protein